MSGSFSGFVVYVVVAVYYMEAVLRISKSFVSQLQRGSHRIWSLS